MFFFIYFLPIMEDGWLPIIIPFCQNWVIPLCFQTMLWTGTCLELAYY